MIAMQEDKYVLGEADGLVEGRLIEENSLLLLSSRLRQGW